MFIFRPMLIAAILFCSMFTALAQSNRDEAIELFRAGKYEKALPILEARVAEEKRDRLAWIYLGPVLAKLDRVKEAKAAFLNHKNVYRENVPVYEKKLQITNRPQAVFTSKARNNGVTGAVAVAVEMLSDGKIGFVFPFVELPDGLTENAVKAARSIKFEPPWQNGKPVTTVNIIEYKFETY